MIWVGLFLFFIITPVVIAYQSGRWESLILPALLLIVCAQWVAADDGESHGMAGIALGLSVIGLVVAAFAVALGRTRRIRR